MMVDFPDPETPTIAVNFPAGTDMVTSFRTVTILVRNKIKPEKYLQVERGR